MNTTRLTQNNKVIRYMRQFGRITQREAIRLGIYRLPARIDELRKAGYGIRTDFRTVTNADGSKSRVGVYSFTEAGDVGREVD